MKNHHKGSLLGALLLAAACGAVSSCNLIVVASGDACETDEDCVNLPNTACDTEQGTCVSVDKCQSNSECTGANEICRAVSPRTCVPLIAGNANDPAAPFCNQIYPEDGTAFLDGTMIIGLTAPLTEQDAAGEYVPSSTGLTTLAAAKLGVDEINEKGGVNGTNRLALVICDDHGNRAPAEETGRFLAAMGVQAIIGPSYSGQTLDATQGTPAKPGDANRPGTVANDVLVMSTSATSPDITGIPDTSPRCLKACGDDTTCAKECPGLVWRTSPSDRIQGDGLNRYFKEELEDEVKNRTMVPKTTIKVTILHKGDSYGINLADYIRTGLEINDQKATDPSQMNNFHVRSYGDTSKEETPDPDAAAIAATVAEQPDAIFLIGTTEVGTIMDAIEAQWTGTDDARPYYILTDGGIGDTVLTKVTERSMSHRVRGSVPGKLGGNFTNYANLYVTQFPAPYPPPEVFGGAGTYDAIYLLTYAATASGSFPFKAESLALGLARTADTSQMPVNVGKGDFGIANNALQSGQSINFEGASGPLDFDTDTGEAPSDILIWCVRNAQTAPFTGKYYHPGSAMQAQGIYTDTVTATNAMCPPPP